MNTNSVIWHAYTVRLFGDECNHSGSKYWLTHAKKYFKRKKTKQYRFVAKRVANNSKIVVMPLKKLKAFCESDNVINQSFVSLTL